MSTIPATNATRYGRLPGETAIIVMAAIEAAQHLTSDEPVDKGGPAGPPDVNISAKSPKSTTNADALVMMAESFLANVFPIGMATHSTSTTSSQDFGMRSSTRVELRECASQL